MPRYVRIQAIHVMEVEIPDEYFDDADFNLGEYVEDPEHWNEPALDIEIGNVLVPDPWEPTHWINVHPEYRWKDRDVFEEYLAVYAGPGGVKTFNTLDEVVRSMASRTQEGLL